MVITMLKSSQFLQAPFKEDIPLKEGKKMECPMAAIHKSRDEHKEFTKVMTISLLKYINKHMHQNPSSIQSGILCYLAIGQEANMVLQQTQGRWADVGKIWEKNQISKDGGGGENVQEKGVFGGGKASKPIDAVC